MLSYRHAFHAGGPADVLKHAVLSFVLAEATTEPSPLYVLDTHAGAGIYDLSDAMSAKLAEYAAGILPVLRAPDPPRMLRALLGEVLALNPGRELRWYPGSAALAARLTRAADRLELVELHPTDHALLAERAGDDPRVRVIRADGLEFMLRRLPPAERRGIIFIDPSYEIEAERSAVVDALGRSCRRFGAGCFILWYPVIERTVAAAFLAAIARLRVRAYRIELAMRPDGAERGLTASGLVVVNPPRPLVGAAATGLPWLASRLGASGHSSHGWLAPI